MCRVIIALSILAPLPYFSFLLGNMVFSLGTTPVDDTVRIVAAYLDDSTGYSQALVQQANNPSAYERHASLTLFHARSVPIIDLAAYAARIAKYCPCNSEVFLALIVYLQLVLDRCARRGQAFTVDPYSIHRLLVTGITVASKWFSDVFFTNSRYAKVGGLSVNELNELELQFLTLVDFDLNIHPEVLQAVGSDLFAGRLPRLTNPFASFLPAPLSATISRINNPNCNGNDARLHRAHRHMSYPGPNGAYDPIELYSEYRHLAMQNTSRNNGNGGSQHPKITATNTASVASRPLFSSSNSTLISFSPEHTHANVPAIASATAAAAGSAGASRDTF